MSKKRSAIIASLFLAAIFLSVGVFRHFHQDEDQRFENYTRSLFCQEVSGSTITLHYTLKDPSAYGIKDTPVTYGACSTDTSAICASVENALALLQSYDRKELSSKNKLTYDVLEDYLSSSVKEAKFSLYDEPLAPLTGTQSQLPVLLSEYQFYDVSDVDTYLKLLSKTPEYFQSIIEFEKAKSEAGLFMASYSADDIMKECQAFIDMGDENYLYSSFEERLKSLKLTAEEQASYIEKNASAIKESIFPSYSLLKNGLAALRTSGKNNNGLCYLPKGREYYENVVASETGSSRTIPQLQQLTQAQMLDDLKAMQTVLAASTQGSSISSDVFKPQGTILEDSNPASILADLEGRLKDSFPAPPEVSTQIKYVQKSMEEYLSPAFYMVPAIDSTKNNVIYINQGHMPDDISLFTTLAHEGYPGHLYQTVYYASRKPDPIRNLLNYGGYTEGWATYSEMMSYYYTPLTKEQATLMQKNTSVILGLYALADMGIHYDGWTLLDTVSFFRGYGITDTNTIEDIYDLIIADPANYLKYYIGYVEFLELKKDAMDKWGDGFTQKRFHKAVLDVGPASFDVIRKHIF
ncbi:DUF885 domain-containing protein [[Clostridium] scindens]|uniref:DUF885 domain-containing protein n=1 Tax=Clostridium scindens (strain JCM 10418 / VPI 12708) TaxID=29347 RepID=UPI001D0808D8|nr:DUF885 domain-containing protein [[Clostridium] scindens]MCB6643783.1 DUF885 domain-containing protein [[Clostridium] scindens]